MRGAVRFPIRLPISVTALGSEHAAETKNISACGVVFQLSSEVEVGSKIQFRIAMPASVLGTSADVLVAGAGRVIRCNGEDGRQTVAAVIDEYHFERTE
ncbi:MAG: PilZ domain-containing protein [Thermomicrobiales bacterium]